MLLKHPMPNAVAGDDMTPNVTFKPINHVVGAKSEDLLLVSRHGQEYKLHAWPKDGRCSHVGQIWAQKKAQRQREVDAARKRLQVTLTSAHCAAAKRIATCLAHTSLAKRSASL